MERKKTLAILVFLLTLCSPIVSFCLACVFGEANVFGVAGIVRYSWIMLLFVPICFISIFIGLILKRNNQNYKKNIIVAVVCLPLLVLFGSYRAIFRDITYDTDYFYTIETKINIKLPRNIKIATIEFDLYNESYVKVYDVESNESFKNEIADNQLWQNTLNLDIKKMLPTYIQYETESCDYFIFFNVTTNQYNMISQEYEYEYIFIAYDCEMQRLIIMENVK